MPASRSPRPSARANVLALPRRGGARALPSVRSILVGVALLLLAGGAYLAARQTSMFAVRAISVRGAPPAVAGQVQAALRPALGRSLLRVDGTVVDRLLAGVPWVESATFDRAFPHTLVVRVRPERPVAVLRAGPGSWLLAATGRVLESLPRGARPDLPRIWIRVGTPPSPGATLADDRGGEAARALAPLATGRLPARVAAVRASSTELTFVLRSGLELRLGDPGDLRLKLAIARRILPTLTGGGHGGGYLDVSVPQRPVASLDSQVGG